MKGFLLFLVFSFTQWSMVAVGKVPASSGSPCQIVCRPALFPGSTNATGDAGASVSHFSQSMTMQQCLSKREEILSTALSGFCRSRLAADYNLTCGLTSGSTVVSFPSLKVSCISF